MSFVSKNPFRGETAYQRRSVERDKSVLAERARQKQDHTKNMREVERMPNIEALHSYLEHSELQQKSGTLVASLPELAEREEICRNFFQCNVWDAEPHLLDDLQAAKQSDEKEQVKHIREMIRAASWASHGRTDGQIATKLTEDYLKQLKEQTGDFEQQGMELWASQTQKRITDAETILDALKSTACDEQAEAAVLAAESLITETWDTFIKEWDVEKKKNAKLPWPNRGVEPPGKLGELVKDLTQYRQIRDQLYYQRLYSHLCQIAKQTRIKKQPPN
ncbi:hypothetical protein COX00_02815 [Candidatus Uhrbacteria bacterium CG22_combo_CG10-13_8_21_14_all_47_17]|uniref:Uncharacterized protein n=1 Tax=Candidatus Uhrbacteria bacterium CG22_combo_CG10-13_8_21_14_all_47_17 TaxID=1975041 RepID=A0A2H0BS63_9BACT|nr:MAG: hypothetical protein COX00_02815 [Candidatus Uhrbacteria bacterium CG22_combo_CG10-13_8_21_14_all_47_17]